MTSYLIANELRLPEREGALSRGDSKAFHLTALNVFQDFTYRRQMSTTDVHRFGNAI